VEVAGGAAGQRRVVARVVGRVGRVHLVRRARRDHAPAVLLDHRDGAAREVAEGVREVGRVALANRSHEKEPSPSNGTSRSRK
jgi:hypothetical protein